MKVKASVPNSGLAMTLGGDYLRGSGITQNEPGQTDANLANPAAGGTNWVTLTDKWQTMYYTSLPTSEFQADPPTGF